MSQNTPDDPTPRETTPDASPTTPLPEQRPEPAPAPAPSAAQPSRLPRALAITGIAVGGALLVGMIFAGGVAVGRLLPDHRGPAGIAMGGFGPEGRDDRGPMGGDRGDRGDRGPIGGDGLTPEQREQFRDEMIERWQELQQQNG